MYIADICKNPKKSIEKKEVVCYILSRK